MKTVTTINHTARTILLTVLTLAAATVSTLAAETNSYYVDAGLVKLVKVAPAEASLSETFSYEITVTASTTVASVMVNDFIPNGSAYVKSEPAASVSGNKLSWKFEKMDTGEERIITVWITANREGELTGCATVTALPLCCVSTFVGKAQLAITKTGPAQKLLHDDVPYAITVTNTGSAVAKNVVVTDNVPAGLTHNSGQTTLKHSVGDLAPNESYDIPIAFTAARTGRVCNIAVASADNTEQVRAEACTVIVQRMLDIVKTGPKEQYLNKNATYGIKVSNPGDVSLTNVTVTDRAPRETRIVSASGARIAGDTATWTLAELKAKESKTFDVVLTTDIAGTHCNKVGVSTTEGLSKDSSACTEWKGYPALLLEVIDTVDPLQIGEHTTYIIRVTNQGTAKDNNVGIAARFPAEITPKGATGATTGTITGKNVKFVPYATLKPKEVIEFKIDAEAAQVGDSRLRVDLTSDLLRTPVPEEESTHVY